MVIDLTGNSNLDDSLLNFSGSETLSKVVSKLKKNIGLFDVQSPLAEAKEELDNLTKSRAELNEAVIKSIKDKDKVALEKASKNLRILNKSIFLIQSEVDYKTKIDYMRANAMSKPTELMPKEVIIKAAEKVEEIESNLEAEKELNKLISNIKNGDEGIVSKTKNKIGDIVENPKDYFTTKNVIAVSFLGLAVYGLVKLVK